MALSHSVHASVVHRAAIAVEHSSGALLKACVNFAGDQISGFQLIHDSGIEYQAQAFGSLGEAICQLDYEPRQTPANCFGTGAYWQYFHRAPSGWVQSGAGASSWMLHDGDMDGWHYATGAAQPPANLTFATVCASPAVPPPSATHSAQTSVAPALPARTPLPTASPPPSASPAIEALAPSPSPTGRVALASTGPPRSSPPGHDPRPLLLLAVGLVLLGALAAWNLSAGRGP